MSALTICLLGCGAIARQHARLLRRLRSPVRLAFASRSRGRAEEYGREFGGALSFGSYAEACASPEVDAVIDCTPPSLHLENGRAAAAHGKHLLVEKPVARSVAELDALAQAVEHAGVLAMVAENYFFKPVVASLRASIERGDIGEPLLLEINRTNRNVPGGWRADQEITGGGALLEGGVHWVNYLVSIAGDLPAEVLAVRPERPYPPSAPVEDTVELLVRFESGMVGKLLHSWYLLNRLKGIGLSKLYGTDGNITFESNGLFALVFGRRTRLLLPGVRDLMGARGTIEHFVDCLRERRAPAMSLAIARRDLALVEAAYRSLSSRRFEAVGSRPAMQDAAP